MFRIGLAGGMGSGKSEVASRLRELGAAVIEADAVARELVEPGTDVLAAIVGEFGSSVLDESGELNRRALAAEAFSSESRLAVLNEITHPPLVREIVRRAEGLERSDPSGVLVVDAALLVQWDVLDMFDVVLIVDAPVELRVQRLAAGGFSDDDARKRIRSQQSSEDMLAAADYVIRNDGSIEELRVAVDRFWRSLPDVTREDTQ